MVYHLAVVLDITAVAADHPVDTEFPQFGIHLGASASGAEVDLVPVGTRLRDGERCALRDLRAVVDQRPVHVQQQDPAGG